jgi:oligopeptide transport system ATP-binding protein
MTPILQVRNLITEFHTQEGVVHAVNNISYSVNKGETLAIVGESGCGKSVSVLSIMRLIPERIGKILSGEVIFEEKDLLKMTPDEMRHIRGNKIAMIFQDPMTSLNPVITIGTQISETIEAHLGYNKQKAYQRSIELLDLVGIPDAKKRMNDYPFQFSGGMRQRVMIAMALSCNPNLLIADEPTTALDVTIQAQIIELVKRLRDELGMAMIWITHDLGVVASLAERVIVMYAGYIVESATVDDLFKKASHPYTQGLLGSLPRLDLIMDEDLKSIEGVPPDLINLPEGCAFLPRCRHAHEKCRNNPTLFKVDDDHYSACWLCSLSGDGNGRK